MAGQGRDNESSDHEHRLYVLEEWRATHDVWAGDKAERLTRVEVKQSNLDEWRADVKKSTAETAKNARNAIYFAIAQLVAILIAIITIYAKK